MDDSLRDIYNRFGSESLDFDPRKDELKLLSNISFSYIYWFVLIYILTISQSARASRTWDIFLCIGVMITEVTLCLTDTSLPTWVPFNLTEYELVKWLHALLPGVISALRAIAEYSYADVDQQCGALLESILEQQKVRNCRYHITTSETSIKFDTKQGIDEILSRLIPLIEDMSAHGGGTSSTAMAGELHSSGVHAKLEELQNCVRKAQEAAAVNMEVLKKSSTNFLSKYYWLVFVLLYAGVYLSQ
jgi:hypothetical protein